MGGRFFDLTYILLLMKLLSVPAKKTFQPRSGSKRSNESITVFFVVVVFRIGINLLDSPMTILVTGDSNLLRVRSWKARLEGEKK